MRLVMLLVMLLRLREDVLPRCSQLSCHLPRLRSWVICLYGPPHGLISVSDRVTLLLQSSLESLLLCCCNICGQKLGIVPLGATDVHLVGPQENGEGPPTADAFVDSETGWGSTGSG